MKTPPRPLPKWLELVCWIGGGLFFCSHLMGLFFSVPMAWVGTQFIHEKAPKDASGLLFLMLLSYGWLLGNLVGLWIGFWVIRLPGKRRLRAQAQRDSVVEPAAEPRPVKVKSGGSTSKRWHSCNILQMASDASRLWQFDAKGGGFALGREHNAAIDQPLTSRLVAKSWSSLWQPRLNVAWLPPENVFLRVIELPRSNFEETFAMVELQLEKLSPMPVAQIVWTMHVLSHPGDAPRRSEAATSGETRAEDLQTVVVVIAERSVVEEFLGKLEGRGYLADRLEVPMLDQLAATPATEDGAWMYPLVLAGQNAMLVAWWCGGALRNLSYVVLPPAGDRANNLKAQANCASWAFKLFARSPAGGRLADRATQQMASGRGSRQCRRMGKCVARRFERTGAGHAAVAAGGTGRTHGAARGGVRFARDVVAGGISRALPSTICRPSLVARPGDDRGVVRHRRGDLFLRDGFSGHSNAQG